MKPVKFLEHVRTYPGDIVYSTVIQRDGHLGNQRRFHSLEDAIECLQKNGHARMFDQAGMVFLYITDEKKAYSAYEFYRQHPDIKIEETPYIECMKFAEYADSRTIYLSPAIDEVYAEEFTLVTGAILGSVQRDRFLFDYGFIYGDYPRYEQGQEIYSPVINEYAYDRYSQRYIVNRLDRSEFSRLPGPHGPRNTRHVELAYMVGDDTGFSNLGDIGPVIPVATMVPRSGRLSAEQVKYLRPHH